MRPKDYIIIIITILLFLFLLFFRGGLAQSDMIIGGLSASGDDGCTSSVSMVNNAAVVNTCGWGVSNTYQEVANADTISICRADVYLSTTTGGGGDGDVYLEIWDFGQTAQIGSDSSIEAISDLAGAPTMISFTWTTPVVVGTDFTIEIFEVDAVALACDTTGGANDYEDTNYDMFAFGTDRNVDLKFKIYTQ